MEEKRICNQNWFRYSENLGAIWEKIMMGGFSVVGGYGFR